MVGSVRVGTESWGLSRSRRVKVETTEQQCCSVSHRSESDVKLGEVGALNHPLCLKCGKCLTVGCLFFGRSFGREKHEEVAAPGLECVFSHR